MAIDPTGRPTTTGIMDIKPSVPKVEGNIGPQQTKTKGAATTVQPTAAPQPKPTPEQEMQLKAQENMQAGIEKIVSKFPGLQNLTDEDNATLDSVLSPSVKNAIGKIVPDLKPLMDMFGSNEPNVVIPFSMASKFAMVKYGGESIEEAIQNFTADLIASSEQQPQMMEQTTVPPSPQPQGLMASPQNMEQV